MGKLIVFIKDQCEGTMTMQGRGDQQRCVKNVSLILISSRLKREVSHEKKPMCQLQDPLRRYHIKMGRNRERLHFSLRQVYRQVQSREIEDNNGPGGAFKSGETIMEIIVVCGSVRFRDEMLKFREEQHKNGNWVLLPENMEIDIQEIDMRVKEKMDSLHRAKIDHSDSVLIWNRNGYIGESTKRELEYSLLRDKPVRYLEAVA